MPHRFAATTESRTGWFALIAAGLCAPAFAASSIDIACDDESEAVHEITISDISANPAAHSEALVPQAEAIIREAFDESTGDAPTGAEDTVEEIAIRDVANPELPVTLPGVPLDEAQRYKRRMYRTDI